LEDELDIYFEKARQALIDDMPIEQVIAKLEASSGSSTHKVFAGNNVVLLVIIAGVIGTGAIYWFYYPFNSPEQEVVTPLDAPIDTTSVANNEQGTSVEAEGNAKYRHIPLVQETERSEFIDERDSIVVEDFDEQLDETNKNNEDQTEVHIKNIDPPADVGASSEVVARREQVREFEILPFYTVERLDSLAKELNQYGIALKIKSLRYRGNQISKIKVELSGRNFTGAIRTNRFKRITFNFQYSKEKGARNMKLKCR